MADNEKVEKNEDEMKKDVSKKADDVPDAQSPITQVNTRDNDAPYTGAKMAQERRSLRHWIRYIFCCCPTPRRASIRRASRVAKPQTQVNQFLLKSLSPEDANKKCLVLDLDETLVHSSFKPLANADFIIPVEIENQTHNVYVLKRPGVDEFLRVMGEHFEVVIFTASLAKYADPLLDLLDIHKVIRHRLFRESCIYHQGNYVKDLSRLGRDLKGTLIIDNSPFAYMFHPENAIAVSSWVGSTEDTELTDMIELLIELSTVKDVVEALQKY